MSLVDAERSHLAHHVQQHVRSKVLETIPESPDDALTVTRIAYRADMRPEAVKAHMVRLRAGGAIARVGCGSSSDPYRYYRPPGGASAAAPEPEEAPMSPSPTEQLLAALPTSQDEALTVPEVADEAGMLHETARSALAKLFRDDGVARIGAGKRGEPYRYFLPAPNGSEPEAAEEAAPDNDVAPEATDTVYAVSVGIDYDELVEQLQRRAAVLEAAASSLQDAIAALELVRTLEAA